MAEQKILTLEQKEIYMSANRQIHAKLLIGRPNQEWVDVTDYLESIDVELGSIEDLGTGTGADIGVRTLSFTLFGSDFAPRNKESEWNTVNRQWMPLLWPYREVVFQLAVSLPGEEPSYWTTVFEGYLGDNIATEPPRVSVRCRDKSKLLQDSYIDVPKSYEGPISAEALIQQIINDYVPDVPPTLYCPVPSGITFEKMDVEYVSVWDAIQNVAKQIGWFLGYRWNGEQYVLTFMEPPRQKDTYDFVLNWVDDIYRETLDISDADIRNVVTVTYRDKNTGQRETVTVMDQDSIAEYRRRAMQIEEADTSLIDTYEKARKFAEACLWDLSQLSATDRINMPLIPEIDVFSTFIVTNPQISSTTDFYAVQSVRHSLRFGERARFRTEVIATGRVVGAKTKWQEMETRPGRPGKPIDGGRIPPEKLPPDRLPDYSLGIEKFMTTLKPPIMVTQKPQFPDPRYPEGTLFFFTLDRRLYESTGDDWELLNAGKLVADEILAGIIEAGGITADAIAANAITADKVGANEIITTSANIRDAVIDDAKIINVEADKITTDRAKITAAQIENIEASQITVGGQPAKLVNPKPEGGHLWHFDRSVVSTDGIQPESGVVYTLRPREGRFGGAVAVEEGTENLVDNPAMLGETGIHSWFSAYGGNVVYSIVDEAYISGTKSQRIQYTSATNDGGQFNNRGISFSLELTIGETYTFSFYGKNWEEIHPISWYPENATTITQKKENLGDGWVRYEYTFKVDDNPVGVHIRPNGNGDYSFDVLMNAPQLEQKPFATSFADGVREPGVLIYPNSVLSLKEATVAAWVKIPPSTHWYTTYYRRIISNVNSSNYNNNRLIFYILPEDKKLYLELKGDDGGPQAISSPEAISEGWHYLVATWSSDEMAIYVDGVKVAQQANPVLPSSHPNPWVAIGARTDGMDHINSLIDELLILPYAATEEEIKAWYNSGAPFIDSEEVVSGGKTIINSEGLKAYDSKGNKTVDIGSETGDAFFRGAVIGAVYNE